MCMEDIRIGRKTQFTEQQTTLSGSFVQVIPASPKRIALILSGAAATSVFFTTQSANPIGTGLVIALASQVIELTIDRHGEMVRAGWFAKALAGTPSIAVFEVLLQDE